MEEFGIIKLMKKDIPLTIERISTKDEQECRITSAGLIASILHDVAEVGTNTALYFNLQRDFIITTILDVDKDGLWVEQGGSPADNRRIAGSDRITLVCSHNNVKVQFTATKASSVTYDGRPAFFLPLPSSIYRLQRREYYRLSLPSSEKLRCVITRGNGLGPASEAFRYKVPVMDISGGGIGLSGTEGGINLIPGERHQGCLIELPEFGPIRVDLTVMNMITLATTRAEKSIKRAGCKFNNLDSHSAAILQRYITDRQREWHTS